MSGYRWLGIMFFILFIIGWESSDWLLTVIIVSFLPVMSCAMYGDLIYEHQCKNKDCCFCEDNKKYKKLLKIQLISYSIVFLLLAFPYHINEWQHKAGCDRLFVEVTTYCQILEYFSILIALIMLIAAVISLIAFLILLRNAEAKSGGPSYEQLLRGNG